MATTYDNFDDVTSHQPEPAVSPPLPPTRPPRTVSRVRTRHRGPEGELPKPAESAPRLERPMPKVRWLNRSAMTYHLHRNEPHKIPVQQRDAAVKAWNETGSLDSMPTLINSTSGVSVSIGSSNTGEQRTNAKRDNDTSLGKAKGMISISNDIEIEEPEARRKKKARQHTEVSDEESEEDATKVERPKSRRTSDEKQARKARKLEKKQRGKAGEELGSMQANKTPCTEDVESSEKKMQKNKNLKRQTTEDRRAKETRKAEKRQRKMVLKTSQVEGLSELEGLDADFDNDSQIYRELMASDLSVTRDIGFEDSGGD